MGPAVIVDNKPGAAGNIGADIVAKAAPDGYTLLLAVNSYTINTTVYRNLPWDLQRDFVPIARYAVSPMVVVVNDKLPVRTLPDLVTYAKAHPGKLNYGSAGAGTAPHLVAEQFLQQTGTSMAHIPYKGSAPSVTALLADEVQVSFGAQSALEAFIKTGRLRTLAVTSGQRTPAMPEVPTVRESLNVDFDADIWYGLLAPAGTPAAIVQKISEDVSKVVADPDTQARLREVGVLAAFLGPQETRSLIQRDVARWRDVATRIKLTLD